MIVGITGGIATGKSTVSHIFAQNGWTVVDLDELAHDVRDNDPQVRTALVSRFGQEIYTDGALNAQRLGQVVFNDPVALAALNQILQPRIRTVLLKQLQSLTGAKVVLDIPLLFEQCYQEICDVVIVVATDYQTQLSRLVDRNQLSVDEAKQRISNQIPLAEKIQQADWTIDNSCGLQHTKLQVDWLLSYLD